MKTFILAATAALALAAPVAANTQLAAPLGVDAAAFTTAELSSLTRAYEENDRSRINFILNGQSNQTSAEGQRAGVQVAIDRAIEEGDLTQARNLRNLRLANETGTTVSARNTGAVPANLQAVANDLGVDAADFTTGELSALARYVEEGDMVKVRGIISRIAN